MHSSNYPKPSSAKSLPAALIKIRELLPLAKARVDAIPTEEMLNSFTGEKELVKIATAEILQRIVMDVFKLRLIIDTQLISSGDTPTVVATLLVLTEDGYQVLRSSTASEQRGAGNFSPVLSAESRAIRLVLRSIGLRTEGEFFDSENASQIKDAQINVPEVTTAGKKKSAKDDQTKINTDVAQSVKKKMSPNTSETKVTPKFAEQKSEYFGIELDKTAVNYVDQLRQVLRAAKNNVRKSSTIADFIQTVLGPNSAKRLEGCTTGELEKLLNHYVINNDSNI